MSSQEEKRSRRVVRMVAGVAAAVLPAALVLVGGASAGAATGCRVDYKVTNQWQGGFGAEVVVTNLGDRLDGWALKWDFTAGSGSSRGGTGRSASPGAR
nr:hypothetical protein GCM10017745_52510 [Saccharothrix mutabilis subsp. capreolus]